MKFKFRKILSDKQVFRAKWTFSATILLIGYLCVKDYMVQAQDDGPLMYNDEEWKSNDIANYTRGSIHYYSKNTVVCNSILLLPGLALLPQGVLAVAYALTLCYLFLGISIVADIFVSGIEKITSKKQIVEIKDANGQVVKTQKVLFWNATVANLTLMALGSSAPEILLSIIEALGNLGGCPGELGPSTIVGSAAFNLLVISAVSIYAVNEENDTDKDKDASLKGIKQINDLGVFAITSVFSVWSYIWLFIVLQDQEVSVTEAYLTLAQFFILVIFAYAADRYKGVKDKREELLGKDDEIPFIQYSAAEIYKELIMDKSAKDKNSDKVQEMKQFVSKTMGTDQIENVDFEAFKKKVDGEGMLTRIKYRHQVGNAMTGKKPVIAKGEVVKMEHAHASNLEEKDRNPYYGFRCLHYSVSEGSGSIRVFIDNKKQNAGVIKVMTIDGDAKAEEDYVAIDNKIEFQPGQKSAYVDIEIKDDEGWEPDEDFFVQLYDVSGMQLSGKDSRCKITILDDDKPGQICFKEDKSIKAIATENVAEVVILRKNGSDGEVTVDFTTVALDKSESTATPGLDFTEKNGTLKFAHGETQKIIEIEILARPDQEQRDESFGIQLSDITPAGAKLSKKSFQLVNIITDIDGKKKQEALKQLLDQIQEEEEKTWKSQFISACMLHPTKNEDGEIDDISSMEVFLHFSCIGWKLLFAFIPPPHYFGGWGCFLCSLGMIGVVTFVVGEFANMFGCVLNIPPAITAITFVALGTSLPDTFASKVAAIQEKYADSAVGNVTGSNSVNVLLGLGLPWCMAATWEAVTSEADKGYKTTSYFVPSTTLGFSVIVFVIVATIGICIFIVRRCVCKGELGGTQSGRAISAAVFVSLWLVYIILSICQSLDIGGIGSVEHGWGIKISAKNPNLKCNK